MDRHLDVEIDRLKQKLLRMAGLVEQSIDKAVRALKERQDHFAVEAIEEDAAINALEIEIENVCLTILARYQPVAADLRFIMAAVKICNDLERMGDHAVNIAQQAQRLIKTPPLKPLIDIPYMANLAQKMVKDALDAFVVGDVQQARAICERDDVVDGLEDQINRELSTYILENPKNISQVMSLSMVAKNLERIADLATNFGEEVIFMVEAKTIKHHFDDVHIKPS
ncbi:MAG: phosphate signaling complex protein PhoU [bacterium]